eukprot:c5723_g1_i1.p2 GENE.c5723_g1_i1~~c5723_g1_i1.p2  ORF type:complete len:114 (-),score=21.80 c5723_g1_i1:48-389(-)
MSVLQKIKEIEDEMARTQKNKATNAHLGLLKAKLAKLKRELIVQAGGKGGGGAGEGFDVSKSGDARVGLVGVCDSRVRLHSKKIPSLFPNEFCLFNFDFNSSQGSRRWANPRC